MKHEQISIELMLENTWTEFEMRLVSIGSLYVLWGALTTPDDLLQRYCSAKGLQHMLLPDEDLNDDQREQRDILLLKAEGAIAYRDWARDNDGQPILRDALVAYCVAFESALKSVAVLFRLAKSEPNWNKPVFVEPQRLSQLQREVHLKWESCGGRGAQKPRVLEFFRDEILANNPDCSRWTFDEPESSTHERFGIAPKHLWPDIVDAFKLRNEIVHSARRAERLDVRKEAFHPNDDLRLTTITLDSLRTALRSVLDPINPQRL